MTAPTDQFVDIAKRGQEAVSTAVRTWTDTVQSFAGGLTGGQPKLPEAHAIVEQYYDFVQQLLDNQRKFTLTVLAASTQAAESVTEQATRAAETVKAHTLHATDAAGERATQAARNAKATAAKN